MYTPGSSLSDCADKTIEKGLALDVNSRHFWLDMSDSDSDYTDHALRYTTILQAYIKLT